MYSFLACFKFKSKHKRSGTLKSISFAVNDLQEEKREIDIDHISGLPDDILLQILTLVPIEEAVLTSFLSKRWKPLWIELPLLDLDFISFSKRFNKLSLDDQTNLFLEFVEYVFFRSKIKQFPKLRLGFAMASKVYRRRIRNFIRFAMKSNCSSLDLEGSFSISISTLLPCSFRNESLNDLKLTNCKFTSSVYENFVSLKTAIMTEVKLLDDSVYNLILNSPCLEELQLIKCRISSHLQLHHPRSKLKSLVLYWCDMGSDDGRWIEVNIPTLSQFKFAGIFPEHISIVNGENLIEVALDLMGFDLQRMQLLDILKGLNCVKILSLCSWCLKILSETSMTIMPTTFNNLRHLTVESWSENSTILCLEGLLRSAPFLETLSVHFRHFGGVLQEFKDDKILSSTFWKPHLLRSDFVSHLKKVEIKGFYGGPNEMELVKIMLKNSLSLEKMIIRKEKMKSRYEIVKQRGDENHLKILQRQQEKIIENVVAFARGSSVAQVIFD